MHKKLLLFLLFFSSAQLLPAQTLEVGAFGGISYYNGDLNPGIPFNKMQAVYGVLARYNAGTRWAFRFNINSGKLESDVRFARVNVASSEPFNTNITDVSLLAEFNFFDYFTGSRKDYATPFIFGGISTFGTSTTGFGQSFGFNRFSFPFGAGFKYSLGKRLGMAVEWQMHKAFADDVDFAVQTDYTAAIDDQNTNDWFNFTGVSLTYKFNLAKKQKCNSFDNNKFK